MAMSHIFALLIVLLYRIFMMALSHNHGELMMPRKINVEVWRGQVRLPMPLFEWVQERAKGNFRSVNAELLEIVREAMKRSQDEQSARERL